MKLLVIVSCKEHMSGLTHLVLSLSNTHSSSDLIMFCSRTVLMFQVSGFLIPWPLDSCTSLVSHFTFFLMVLSYRSSCFLLFHSTLFWFIYLVLTVLGLHCCTWAFSFPAQAGATLWLWCMGFSLWFLASHCCGAQA